DNPPWVHRQLAIDRPSPGPHPLSLHDALPIYRAEHDITGSMDKVYAQNFVAAVAELVDVHHDDDTELGRHVRRLIEQEYRKQFWAYQIADATLAARES